MTQKLKKLRQKQSQSKLYVKLVVVHLGGDIDLKHNTDTKRNLDAKMGVNGKICLTKLHVFN